MTRHVQRSSLHAHAATSRATALRRVRALLDRLQEVTPSSPRQGRDAGLHCTRALDI